jgi:demethoxyubiquinone hydroxylase (CLK1/Coq7/Cat5 family)
MTNQTQVGERVENIDVSVIRPQLRMEDFKIRGHNLSYRQVRTIRKSLRVLHNLEVMAGCIYRLQIRRTMCEHNRELIAAMCNEMSHLQDYLVLLFEYSTRPAKTRAGWWFLGSLLGYTSRLMGRTVILKTGIWIEKKTIHHYEQLLKSVDGEQPVRAILEKNLADEHAHIQRWKDLLRSVEPDY